MKKLLLMASAVVFTLSCSSSDDNSDNGSNNNNSKITPPTWIQGTWVDKETYDEVGYKIGFTFKSNDICMINVAQETCWKEIIDQSNSTPNYPYPVNVEQKISDIEYKCSITHASQTIHYNFQRVSSNTIKNIDNGAIYTKI